MIFEAIVGKDMRLCTLMTLTVNFLSFLVSIFVAGTIEKSGRRKVLIIGQIIIVLSLFGVAASSYFELNPLFSLLGVTAFMMGFGLGIGIVFFIWIADVLPDDLVTIIVILMQL